VFQKGPCCGTTIPNKKRPNYEKFKGYIDGLKQECTYMERELMILAGKYEARCQEMRKANALIEHLVDRLSQKIDRKDFIEALNSSQAREPRNDLSDDLMRLLERAEQLTVNSRQNTSIFEEEPFLPPKPAFHYFESCTHLS
jgi:predicted  nucleic acid-binding Zn-ribbon protein